MLLPGSSLCGARSFCWCGDVLVTSDGSSLQAHAGRRARESVGAGLEVTALVPVAPRGSQRFAVIAVVQPSATAVLPSLGLMDLFSGAFAGGADPLRLERTAAPAASPAAAAQLHWVTDAGALLEGPACALPELLHPDLAAAEAGTGAVLIGSSSSPTIVGLRASEGHLEPLPPHADTRGWHSRRRGSFLPGLTHAPPKADRWALPH